MAPVIQTAAHWAVIALALVSNVQASPIAERADKVPLRLMPLGASITDGFRSSDGNGYRKDLRDMLTQNGYSVDMVGSRQSGDMDDNDNEGWGGLKIAEVQKKAEASVPGLQPNLFTINVGTNDCVKNDNTDAAGQRMEKLIDYLWSESPDSTVVLSTLLINLKQSTEDCVVKVNNQFRDLAKRKAADKKRIVLAEMHGPDGPQKDDMADETHPDDGGYLRMAKIWHRAIQSAASKGFLHKPNEKP